MHAEPIRVRGPRPAKEQAAEGKEQAAGERAARSSSARAGLSGVRRGRLAARPALAVAGLAAVVGATLASSAAASPGNGIASMSPTQALDEAGSALAVAQNIVIRGASTTAKGQSLGFSARSVHQGSESSGLISSSSSALGFAGKLYFVITPKSDYLWGTPGFWRAAFTSQKFTATLETKVLKAVSDTWIEIPASQGASFMGSFRVLTDPTVIAHALITHKGSPTTGGTHVVDKVDSLLIQVQGSTVFGFDKGDDVWVSTVGAPLPVEVDATGLPAGDEGSVTLTYPGKLTVVPPKHAETLAQVRARVGK